MSIINSIYIDRKCKELNSSKIKQIDIWESKKLFRSLTRHYQLN